MNEDLRKKLIKDLEKSGLGSAMRALNIFNDEGWSAESGSSYFDKDQNQSREIDITAYHPSNLKVGKKVCVYNFFHICAEVKKTEKPWVVFKAYPEQILKFCGWNNIISYINLPKPAKQFTKALSKNSLLKELDWQGAGIHQAFKDPSFSSRWYSAFTAACKACEDEYESNKSEGKKVSENILEEPTEFNFFQPLVILDGILVTAELSKSDEIVITEVDAAPFQFEFKTKNYSRKNYRVDLVTLSGLRGYLQRVVKRQNDINSAFQNEAKGIL